MTFIIRKIAGLFEVSTPFGLFTMTSSQPESQFLSSEFTRCIVTSLDSLPSDPNFRRIRVDGKIVVKLRAVDLEELSILVGDEWTESIAVKVNNLVNAQKARKLAFDLLGKRNHSSKEISKKLLAKGFEVTIIEQILKELTDDGWVDDRTFAIEYATEILRDKPAGRLLLMTKLRSKMIDPDIAEEVVSELLAASNEFEAALELAKKKLKTENNPKSTATARRVAGLLTRRGFDEETTRTVLSELDFKEFPEE